MSASPYGFYAATLRFAAAKMGAGADDARLDLMAGLLRRAAGELAESGCVTVAATEREAAARAFAGVAGFLQKEILPETVAHGHAGAERQVRWTVDAAMDAVNTLLNGGGDQPVTLIPPPPPQDA